MSAVLNNARPRRIKTTLPRPDMFYVYDDEDESSESDETDLNVCTDNSTQTIIEKSKEYFKFILFSSVTRTNHFIAHN